MRNKFDEELEYLNVALITMGALCEDAISASIKGLFENNKKMLDKAVNAEEQIDRKERDIEALCMKLLLQQQPVARDLRTISSALKMISDMERIGDQASDIAEIAVCIGDKEVISEIHIRDMANAAVKMVTDSVESFVKKDLELAHSVMKYDDTVDELFDTIKNELISFVSVHQSSSEACIDLLMVAKYLERIGDHAVNIAEWVEYSLTGHHQQENEL